MTDNRLDVGEFKVFATSGRGHTPEEWTDMLMSRLMYISDGAPDPIKQQAYAFKGRVANEILYHIQQAVKSDRLTICNRLKAMGHSDIAEYIWSTP